MGYPIIRYTCPSCGRDEPAGGSHKPRYYQLEDGRYIRLNWCVGWCFSCDGVQDIEDISIGDQLAAIRRVSASLASAKSRWRWFSTALDCHSFHALDEGLDISREFGTDDFHEMAKVLEEAREEIEYLSGRIAPPRCLKCSGHEVERLNLRVTETSRGWSHPGCGGTLEMRILGGMNLIPSKTRLVYKPDGQFSHEEPKPQSTVQPKVPWFSD